VQSWGMLANDQVGDCTAAAVYHLIQLWLSNNSIAFTPTDAEAIALYSNTSSYPNADDGAAEIDVLKYWAKTGVPTSIGTDVVTFASLNPRDLNQLKLSIEWFGGAYLGVDLPITAQDQTAEWDVVSTSGDGAAGSWGGHAVCAVAYDQQTFTVVTWGQLMKVSNAFMQAYLEEAYAVVSQDWLVDSGISPPGLNWAGLMADMKALT
jgi:hypothetical protein